MDHERKDLRMRSFLIFLTLCSGLSAGPALSQGPGFVAELQDRANFSVLRENNRVAWACLRTTCRMSRGWPPELAMQYCVTLVRGNGPVTEFLAYNVSFNAEQLAHCNRQGPVRPGRW